MTDIHPHVAVAAEAAVLAVADLAAAGLVVPAANIASAVRDSIHDRLCLDEELDPALIADEVAQILAQTHRLDGVIGILRAFDTSIAPTGETRFADLRLPAGIENAFMRLVGLRFGVDFAGVVVIADNDTLEDVAERIGDLPKAA